MRSRMSALVLSLVFVLSFAACNNKQQSQNQPATDNTSAQANQMAPQNPPSQGQTANSNPPAQSQMANSNPPAQSQMANSNPPPQQPPANEMKAEAPPPPPPPPLVIPAGANLVVRMGNTLDTKTTQAGSTFTGTLARSVAVHGETAIPAGAGVTGTVVDSKSPGKFKGEGVLTVTLTSVDVRGVPVAVETSSYSVNVKGKGKRTAVITGGGAGGGALIGGLAGGGKGALIGGLLGAGAGAAGSAFTGNKDLQIPAESVVTFKLANSITVKHSGKKKHADQGDQGTANQ
jgi:hypothetical protein